MEEIMKFEVKFIHKYLKMKSNMKNILTLVLFVFLVTSCNSENKFDINNVDVNLSNKIEKNILETKIVGKSVSLLSQSKSEQISKMLDEPEKNKVSSLVNCLAT